MTCDPSMVHLVAIYARYKHYSLITSNSHHITIFSWYNAHDPTNRMLTTACLSCLNIRQHIFIHRITWNFNLQQSPLKKSVKLTQETLHLQLILILAINVQINTNHNNQARPQISETKWTICHDSSLHKTLSQSIHTIKPMDMNNF